MYNPIQIKISSPSLNGEPFFRPSLTPLQKIYVPTTPTGVPARNEDLVWNVKIGDEVSTYQKLGTWKQFPFHSPCCGKVISLNGERVELEVTHSNQINVDFIDPLLNPLRFLQELGLSGMGGAGFPSYLKAQSAKNKIHTLVINGCECEPGVYIDHAILNNYSHSIQEGVRYLAEYTGAKNIILAIHSSTLSAKIQQEFGHYQILRMPEGYPSGAEKLILGKLIGKIPPFGVLPFQLGYLVHNVSTLWALGEALRYAKEQNKFLPSVLRPLHVIHTLNPQQSFFAIVPVGMTIQQLFESRLIEVSPQSILVQGGCMMGKWATLDTPISKTTTSIFILALHYLRQNERSCIRCGACFDACPLHLHPILLVEKIRESQQQNHPLSPWVQAHLHECFLCGACDAVCPSHIPLAMVLRQGKQKRG